jgi:ribosome maturation factor RimP
MNLESEIAKIIKVNGAEFYDSEIVSEMDETIFRVYISKEGGVDLDLCVEVTHALSPFLDVHPPVSGHYRLEVSSPGIERRLRKPEHFKGAVGETIKISVIGKDRLQCLLKDADDQGITIETGHGEERYGYAQIKKARTLFDWNKEHK